MTELSLMLTSASVVILYHMFMHACICHIHLNSLRRIQTFPRLSILLVLGATIHGWSEIYNKNKSFWYSLLVLWSSHPLRDVHLALSVHGPRVGRDPLSGDTSGDCTGVLTLPIQLLFGFGICRPFYDGHVWNYDRISAYDVNRISVDRSLLR